MTALSVVLGGMWLRDAFVMGFGGRMVTSGGDGRRSEESRGYLFGGISGDMVMVLWDVL